MRGRIRPTRPRTSRVVAMLARQRRRELAAIIASGIAKAVALRADGNDRAQQFAVEALARSAESRRSVPLAERPDRDARKAGEQS